MRVKARHQGHIKTGEVEMEGIYEFRYLGSYNCKDGTNEKDFSSKIGLVAEAFQTHNIYRLRAYEIRTRVKIYKSNFHSLVVYIYEIWKRNSRCDSRFNEFETFYKKIT